MFAKRIIPCLDCKDGRVVKGVRFVDLRDAGDPGDLAESYDREGADELVMLDISASREGRTTLMDTVSQVARKLFIPLTVGGGVRSLDDARRLLSAGADKVAVNTAAVETPELVGELAAGFGSQAVVVAIDADGTQAGFDCELTATVSRGVPIPVIASGGAGSLEHFAEVFLRGAADAALAASVFHFEQHTIRSLKEFLRARGVPVRTVDSRQSKVRS